MSTYSLTLRSQINRRLNVNEMDANFLYLQDLANSSSVGPTGPMGPTGANGTGGTGSGESFDQDLNTFDEVQFDSVTTEYIIGQDGAVILMPDNNVPWQSVVVYPTNNVIDENHVHIAPIAPWTDLFLGPDESYVAVKSTGDIVIEPQSGTVSVKGDLSLLGKIIGLVTLIDVEQDYTWLQGVAIDDEGNQYVAGGIDSGSNLISKITNNEFVWTKEIVDNTGSSPSVVPNISNIEWLNGFIYVSAEWDNSFTVIKIDENGNVDDSWSFESDSGFDLTEMTVDPILGPIVIGRKNDEYYFTATFSNTEITGTVSNFSINKDYFDEIGFTPKVWANWEIIGDGLSDWTYVNTNNTNKINDLEVTTVTGNGTGLRASISYDLNSGTYPYVDVWSNGTGYQNGDNLLIKGSLLGNGIDGKTYSANLFNNTGESLYFLVSSYPDFDQVVQNGWRISGNGINDFGIVSNLQNTGALWRVDIGQDVTLTGGDEYLFDNNNGDDLTFIVGYTNNNQVSYFTDIQGIPNFDNIILELSQGVDFSQSGNWMLRISKNDQGFIWTENWTKSIGEFNNQYANCVTTDSNHNIYVGAQYDRDEKSALIIKFDSEGNKVWAKYFDDNINYNLAISLNCDSQDNLYIVSMNDNGYAVITKTDTNGDVIWQKTMTDQGWDYNFKSALDSEDNIVISGAYNFNSSYDYVFIKLDSNNGNVIWGKSIGRESFDEYDYWNYESKTVKSIGDIVYKVGYAYNENYSSGIVVSIDTKSDIVGSYDGWVLKNFTSEFDTTINSPITATAVSINNISIDVNPITFETSNIDLLLTNIQLTSDNNIKNTNSIQFSDGSILKSSLIKQNLQSSYNDYTLQLSDINGHVYKNDGDGYGIYVPSNEQVPFPIGSAITIVSGNDNVFFYLEQQNVSVVEIWGAGYNQTSTGWFIPHNSIATLLKIDTDKWMLSGAGLNID